MAPQRNTANVQLIMTDFAERTGLLNDAVTPVRYLWTDAFAVCNFLSLSDATGDQQYLNLARKLVDQVHLTLGRYRRGSSREGWISGRDEDVGRQHPTIGGLRIGKPLDERGENQPYDERLEWQRDGQYFHYLTKWMHALARMAVVAAEPVYCRWALELAQSAHAAFTYRAGHSGPPRMYWKMSVDLSRPLVPSMGHHDPLDAFVTYHELEHCHRSHFPTHPMPDVIAQTRDARAMSQGRNWASEDPLGLGGLLTDAYRTGQLDSSDSPSLTTLLQQILTDAAAGLRMFVSTNPLRGGADERLAFRELGLSIGLHALEVLGTRLQDDQSPVAEKLQDQLALLLPFMPLADQIESFWGRPASQSALTWLDHQDINSVMLATSLLPKQFLLV